MRRAASHVDDASWRCAAVGSRMGSVFGTSTVADAARSDTTGLVAAGAATAGLVAAGAAAAIDAGSDSR